MVDCRKLCSNLNFWLKIVAFVLVQAVDGYFVDNLVAISYLLNAVFILLALVIAYIFLKTTKLAEIYLLIVALASALIGMIVYAVAGDKKEQGAITYTVALVVIIGAMIAITADIILRARKTNLEEENLPQ